LPDGHTDKFIKPIVDPGHGKIVFPSKWILVATFTNHRYVKWRGAPAMNYEGVCSRDELADWLDKLAVQVNLIAPVFENGVLLNREVGSHKDIAIPGLDNDLMLEQGYVRRPVMSAKEVLFPSTEQLFKFKMFAGQIQFEETLPEKQQVLFGLTPCDARGVSLLDGIFIDNQPPDVYYASRREKMTLVGLACREMGDSCYCTSCGSAPNDPSDMDIMLSEIDEGYLIQVINENSRSLLTQLNYHSDISHINLENLTNETKVAANPVSVPIPDKEIMPHLFDDQLWAKVAESCLSCRICSYVCPTCRCFDVRDEMLPFENGGENYQRIRCWDSCSRDAYRRIAGGHTPRADEAERLRNRIFCKFYYLPQQYSLRGEIACTGCGRCIDACPVNIDITEILGYLAEVVHE
jgi:sulfhydrogenase subunit beta (sulfur reductase)